MKQTCLTVGAIWLVAGASLSAAAWADTPDPTKPPVSIDKLSKTTPPPRVSEEAARRIAWRSGVDHIEEIMLAGEHWEVAGRDRAGNELALDIHAHDGRVLD